MKTLFWLGCVAPIAATAQVLREIPPASPPPQNPPLILRDAGNATGPAPEDASPEAEVNSVILKLRRRMRAVGQSSVSAAEKQEALDKLVSEHPGIFRQREIEREAPRGESVDNIILKLERQIFELGLQSAPDEQSRDSFERNWQHAENLEPNRPILIARKAERPKIIVTREAETKGYTPWWKTAQAAPAKPKQANAGSLEKRPADKVDEEPEPVTVEFLADQQVTTDMHDDNTVLRQVEDDEGDLVLFDALHLWMGGSVQLDGISMDGLFTQEEGGGRESDLRMRRAELILRASLMDLGEIKFQYDFEATVVRDLYWRWVSESSAKTLTVGNQKEPMGLDYLVGNKFGTAMERSAPASAFGSYRSKGVRYNRWFDLNADERLLDVWGEEKTYVTTSFGIFGEDIESSHETDWAVTGRVTGGVQRKNNTGLHLGVSGSYREGHFDGISPRPEVHEASRILLAQPQAEQQAILGLEALFLKGSLHSQVEFYYSDYRGGAVDGEGFGAYAQVGWLFGGNQRPYRARWGMWGPVSQKTSSVFEVFGRVSYTRGEDDINGSNELRLLTLGGSWYYRQFRSSINLVLAETAGQISSENSGNALTARLQYLF